MEEKDEGGWEVVGGAGREEVSGARWDIRIIQRGRESIKNSAYEGDLEQAYYGALGASGIFIPIAMECIAPRYKDYTATFVISQFV